MAPHRCSLFYLYLITNYTACWHITIFDGIVFYRVERFIISTANFFNFFCWKVFILTINSRIQMWPWKAKLKLINLLYNFNCYSKRVILLYHPPKDGVNPFETPQTEQYTMKSRLNPVCHRPFKIKIPITIFKVNG